MHTITVRQAVLADLDALAPLFDRYRQFYGGASDVNAARRFLLARFDHGESILMLAHANGEPVGFTQLYPSFSSLSMARIYVLNDLFVAETARRKGVGKALLDASATLARTLGAATLTLSTAVDNVKAQALYERNGWQRDTAFYNYDLRLAR